jgi:hypothetical protein
MYSFMAPVVEAVPFEKLLKLSPEIVNASPDAKPDVTSTTRTEPPPVYDTVADDTLVVDAVPPKLAVVSVVSHFMLTFEEVAMAILMSPPVVIWLAAFAVTVMVDICVEDWPVSKT